VVKEIIRILAAPAAAGHPAANPNPNPAAGDPAANASARRALHGNAEIVRCVAMRYGKRTRSWWYAVVVSVQFFALWFVGPVLAGIESYDPRLDPNYTRATSGNSTLDWRAIEMLAREFQERGAAVGSRPAAVSQYVQPQPWHYAGTDNSMMASQAGYADFSYWTPPIGGPYQNWYGPGIYGWRDSSRIPWWSLVPSRHHHRSAVQTQFHGRHSRAMGHRGW
jgi:hypothetical protein